MNWNPAVGIPLIIIGVIVLVLIWLFGQPRKPRQGRRTAPGRKSRREPSLGNDDDERETTDVGEAVPAEAQPDQGELEVGMRAELERLGATLAGSRQHRDVTPSAPMQDAAVPGSSSDSPKSPAAPDSTLGRRPGAVPVKRIVSIFLMGREGRRFQGADLMVTMEKAGLEFGNMNIYHRLLDGKPEQGAVFSVANMVKPGSFAMASMSKMETPGLSFFMTLPGPLSALDAWDMMLPTAQRLERLLDGHLLDDERNALGRQRIAHIRDDLRAWDRRHEGPNTTFGH